MRRQIGLVMVVLCMLVAAATGAFAAKGGEGYYEHPEFPFESVEEGEKHGYPTDLSGPTALEVPEQYRGGLAPLSGVAGTMLSDATVKGGPGSAYASLGSIASGTQVTVIEYDGSYYFIEYGSPARRGYVLKSTVSCGGPVPPASYTINFFGLNNYGATLTVRGGPSTSYASIGSISAREIITVLREESSWYFFEYWTSSGNKRGYAQTGYIYVPRFDYDEEGP